jgi:inosine/xanthosine triphosphatase
MKINVGTKNIQKIDAVKETLKEYTDFKDSEVIGVKADSLVSDQPKSMDETINGAINRAKNCFNYCDYSFGIESGLMKVPETKTGYMDFTCCAIFDGEKIHLGLSSAFEYPLQVTKMVFDENIDINEAFFKTGLTENPNLGSAEGGIGFLTKGRILRRDYTKQAIYMALIHLENPELYSK